MSESYVMVIDEETVQDALTEKGLEGSKSQINKVLNMLNESEKYTEEAILSDIISGCHF